MSAVGDHSNKRGTSRESTDYAKWRPNRREQSDRFARDRAVFESNLCRAPRRQLKRSTFGGLFHTFITALPPSHSGREMVP